MIRDRQCGEPSLSKYNPDPSGRHMQTDEINQAGVPIASKGRYRFGSISCHRGEPHSDECPFVAVAATAKFLNPDLSGPCVLEYLLARIKCDVKAVCKIGDSLSETLFSLLLRKGVTDSAYATSK